GGGGSISGTVLQASDGTTPISDMLIIAFTGNEALWYEYEVSTEMDGTYVINDLPAGNYIVCSEDDFGQGYVDECYNGVFTEEAATQVTVSGTSDTPNIDFTLVAQP
ncbi:MAG: hypothetical protein O3A33_09180, partial [Chloroflexi bacterium]|nr:hypothetical protein [Chloroflexota bacterium]